MIFLSGVKGGAVLAFHELCAWHDVAVEVVVTGFVLEQDGGVGEVDQLVAEVLGLERFLVGEGRLGDAVQQNQISIKVLNQQNSISSKG